MPIPDPRFQDPEFVDGYIAAIDGTLLEILARIARLEAAATGRTENDCLKDMEDRMAPPPSLVGHPDATPLTDGMQGHFERLARGLAILRGD